MGETPGYIPPEAKSPSEQLDTEAQGELEGLKNEEVEQVGDWFNKRAEILQQAWEKGEDFDEVKEQVVDIFKLGLAAGFKEAVVVLCRDVCCRIGGLGFKQTKKNKPRRVRS